MVGLQMTEPKFKTCIIHFGQLGAVHQAANSTDVLSPYTLVMENMLANQTTLTFIELSPTFTLLVALVWSPPAPDWTQN